MRVRNLDRTDELEALLEESRARPVWILKHSLACGVSGAALEELRAFAEERPAEEIFRVVVVQHARALCDDIARRTGVPHRSPQLFLVRDGEVVWHDSHWAIEVATLRDVAERALSFAR